MPPPNSSPQFLDKHHITTAFNRAATHYNEYAKLQREVADNLIERIEDFKLSEIHSIADVGCGSGYVSQTLQRQFPTARVQAYDLAPNMVQQARQQHRPAWWQWRHPKVQYICADAAQLPLPNHSVDLLLSNLMLQWCDDVFSVFTEWSRVLKPNGILLFSTFGPDTLKELRHSWAQVDQHSHVNDFIDMHHLGDALLASGLTDPVVDVDWLVRHYPDAKTLMRELKGMGAHNVTAGRSRSLTGKQRFQTMLDAYHQFQQADGSIPATYEVVYGQAIGHTAQPVGFSANNEGEIHIPLSSLSQRKT